MCPLTGVGSLFAFIVLYKSEGKYVVLPSVLPSMMCVRSIDSYSVWVRHLVCGLFPTGSPAGSGEQYIGNKSGCVEADNSVQAHGARESPGHRRVAAHHARNSHPGCGDQRE